MIIFLIAFGFITGQAVDNQIDYCNCKRSNFDGAVCDKYVKYQSGTDSCHP